MTSSGALRRDRLRERDAVSRPRASTRSPSAAPKPKWSSPTGQTRRHGPTLRERWPDVRLLSFDEPMAIPELRAAGVFAVDGSGRRADRGSLPGHGGLGRAPARRAPRGPRGRRRPDPERRHRSPARLGGVLLRVQRRHGADAAADRLQGLPGMNVSYDRRALAAIDDLLREGRWENWLHPRLQERGFELCCEPEAVVEHDKDFDLGEFFSQRYHYSRSYAGMRNPTLGSKRGALRARNAAAPAARLRPHGAQRLLAPTGAEGVPARDAADPALRRGLGVRRGGRLRLRRRAQPAQGAVSGTADRRRRHELGEPARLRPVRAQCARTPRRTRRRSDATSSSIDEESALVGRLPDGRRASCPCALSRDRPRRPPPRLVPPSGRSRPPGHRGDAARGSTPSSSLPCTRASRSIGAPSVVGLHDLIADDFPELTLPERDGHAPSGGSKQSLADRGSRGACSRCRRPRGDAVAKRFGVAADRIAVVPEAPDPVFTPRPAGSDRAGARRARPPAGEPFLLYAGGISPHKDVETLRRGLRAAAQASEARRGSSSSARSTTTRISRPRRRPCDADRAARPRRRRASLPGYRLGRGARLPVQRGDARSFMPSLAEGFGCPRSRRPRAARRSCSATFPRTGRRSETTRSSSRRATPRRFARAPRAAARRPTCSGARSATRGRSRVGALLLGRVGRSTPDPSPRSRRDGEDVADAAVVLHGHDLLPAVPLRRGRDARVPANERTRAPRTPR